MGEIVIYEGVLYMCFQWPDPISFVADVIAIVGIPTLVVSTAKLYKDAKKAREPQNVSHGCLEFYDVDEKVGINLVPWQRLPRFPGRATMSSFLASTTIRNLWEAAIIRLSMWSSPISQRPMRSINPAPHFRRR